MTKHQPGNSVPILLPGRKVSEREVALPRLLGGATRGPDSPSDPFINDLTVQTEAVYDLSLAARGESERTESKPAGNRILALEAEDGTTIFVRADKFREDLERLYPESVKEGTIDLSLLRDREGASRGLGDWIWSKLSVIRLSQDGIVDLAANQAKDWVLERLGEQARDKLETLAGFSASTLGAKALMWAVESRLPRAPGLYRWSGGELVGSDHRPRGDKRLIEAAEAGPLLVFIHGTASHTVGSFGGLHTAGGETEWARITRHFGNRVFGFEHRTFSESPIDNALELAESLPEGARLCLVTHSRGGLVGDLMCLAGLDEDLIRDYRTARSRANSQGNEAIEKAVNTQEQANLRRLRDLLSRKNFRIERYLRVACPARGTRLLSDNLEVFLSGLLSLMSRVVGLATGPAAAAVLSAFKRIVLEIVDKRLDPRLVPGIEAMLTDSPMGMLLTRASRKQGVQMAVIAGDVEGGNLMKRIAVMFTDWMFFDRVDNDLVVDTDSMYGGLAGGEPAAKALFVQGSAVNHFSYFERRRTREALKEWLVDDSPDELTAFSALDERREPNANERRVRAAHRGAPRPDTRPVVLLLPGIMGSHLELFRQGQKPGDGDRVWFDPIDIMRGGFAHIRYGASGVREESLFEMFYGDLADHLETTHTVVRFPYDWRRPVQDAAEDLAGKVRQALQEHPSQPVRLLAHSMGGLVARAMIAKNPELWTKMVERPGGRLVMLGTPNHGSHMMVASLLGKADTLRKLACFDFRHSMQELLDIVAGFPGAVQLLPRPGFKDRGMDQATDYLVSDLWANRFKRQNRDRWFGHGTVGVPTDDALAQARALWKEVLTGTIEPVERLTYVYGRGENTPCGVALEGGRLKMVGTSEGDGTVTWASGRLDFLPAERCWFMPVEHGSLADTESYFPAIVELLETGATQRLGRLPVSRGQTRTYSYDAGPVAYPTAEELMRSLMGSRPRRRLSPAAKQRLEVRVMAMDLRQAQLPMLCGHYANDPISGAEAQIDRHLVNGALKQRDRLGLYAGALGSSAIVLMPRSEEEMKRGTRKGAVIVGLGEMDKLSAADIGETVRAGVLSFLLRVQDRDLSLMADPVSLEAPRVGLASLLIGYNSTTHITVEDSVDAIVRGVCEANRQFEEATRSKLRVSELVFTELFLDSAITAAHALRGVPQRLERDLERLETEVVAAQQLHRGEGVQQRLYAGGSFGYWPRVMVTDADGDAALVPRPNDTPTEPSIATNLKFVYLSARARAETVMHQRQPGLVEKLVEQAIGHTRYNADLSHTLFQLMVPPAFKQIARETDRLVLVVDGYTANLPWEMLQPGDEPMVLRTALVRQLVSSRPRRPLLSMPGKTACVIASPSTEGFQQHFGKPDDPPLPPLDGAVKEGETVRGILNAAHYEVTLVRSGAKGADVVTKLFNTPYRLLVIAAHGVFQARARDGAVRSGVVLSDGMLLTAAEVGQMEVIPEVVFLNCCHLGKVDPSSVSPNKLAYSLAREFIEMGVRCVVAAGWAVDDDAARTFAGEFFTQFVEEGRSFGNAVLKARQAAYTEHPGINTWGAYQAYGDPEFVLERSRSEPSPGSIQAMVSSEELVARLERLRVEAKHQGVRDFSTVRESVESQLRAAPPEWGRLPEVQATLGSVYAEAFPEGFALARAAYLRAVSEEDKAGRVPVKLIEQLANLEARAARKLSGKGGYDLIDRAIDRLEGLLEITGDQRRRAPGPSEDDETLVNRERWSLLGGAWKSKAGLQAVAGEAWSELRPSLTKARDAYARAQGSTDDPDFDPYPMLNRLQLDVCLSEKMDMSRHAELAAKCETAARRRFQESYTFWDAVMVADARLTAYLLSGKLGDAEGELKHLYRDVSEQVPKSALQWNSVTKQLQLLSTFRKLGGDPGQAQSLSMLAATLDPNTARAKSTAAPNAKPRPKKRNSSKRTRKKGDQGDERGQ